MEIKQTNQNEIVSVVNTEEPNSNKIAIIIVVAVSFLLTSIPVSVILARKYQKDNEKKDDSDNNDLSKYNGTVCNVSLVNSVRSEIYNKLSYEADNYKLSNNCIKSLYKDKQDFEVISSKFYLSLSSISYLFYNCGSIFIDNSNSISCNTNSFGYVEDNEPVICPNIFKDELQIHNNSIELGMLFLLSCKWLNNDQNKISQCKIELNQQIDYGCESYFTSGGNSSFVPGCIVELFYDCKL